MWEDDVGKEQFGPWVALEETKDPYHNYTECMTRIRVNIKRMDCYGEEVMLGGDCSIIALDEGIPELEDFSARMEQ